MNTVAFWFVVVGAAMTVWGVWALFAPLFQTRKEVYELLYEEMLNMAEKSRQEQEKDITAECEVVCALELELHCPMCDARGIKTKIVLQRFQYGSDDHPAKAMLEVEVPERHCTECGGRFIDAEGMEARDRRVQEYLREGK